jgi:uridine phosphorylase
MQIPASELILNPDGSVYHLNLLPGDIAETIVLVGDPDRVPLVSERFDTITLRKQKREFVTHTGTLNGKPLTVLSTGIGTDNIDIVLNELNILANINLQTRERHTQHTSLKLVRIGTSGALRADIAMDTVLVSSHGLGLDLLLHYYPHSMEAQTAATLSEITAKLDIAFLKPYLFKAPGNLINQFAEFEKGITATCSGFYAPQGRLVNSASTIPNLITQLSETGLISNFEMETAAIYGLATLFGHEAVSVNAIVANRITGQFSSDGQSVIEHAITRALAILTE